MDRHSEQRILTSSGEASAREAARRPLLSAACAAAVGVRGAAVGLVAHSGFRSLVCASNAAASALEDVHRTLGEGPGVDAHCEASPVTEPDVVRAAGRRWPAFHRAALDAGSAAVFAFPLRLRGVGLGVLTLEHDRPGRLDHQQYVGALAVADAVSRSVAAARAHATEAMLVRTLAPLGADGAAIHQATGMVADRLQVTVDEALACLRALAQSGARPLADIAHEVVARTYQLN